jgi:hypothetical protein
VVTNHPADYNSVVVGANTKGGVFSHQHCQRGEVDS